MSDYRIDWNFINIHDFTADHLKDYNIQDLRKMFLRESQPMVPELAYLAFLQNSPWGVTFNIEHGIQRILLQLRLPLFEGKGLTFKETTLNSAKIWASEDSLDFDKIEMVKVATQYMIKTHKPIPPVAVWLIKNDGRYNYVVHDGHHRSYVFHILQQRVPAVLMEYWLDNREESLLAKRLRYRQIDTYVKDLPLIKRDF